MKPFNLLFIAIMLVCIGTLNCDGDSQRHWALLVAGSNGYYNYRHQADICHAYHVLHNHGIPDERIVVMMYDDIANNAQNPYPGNIINEPNGPNLYPGVLKDYTKDDVTPEIFLKVLSGDEEGIEQALGRKGKVIKSGPNDTIFINFADHGAPGLLGFPSNTLLADDLNNAINGMYENKQYKKMVIYVEACESGSIFNNLLRDDINVFATTAANPDQSSYACYYDEKRETYLGDLYSVSWMQDSDVENLKMESLQKQYRIVKKETNTSQVMEYGDLKMKTMKVAEFQGTIPVANYNALHFHSEKKRDQRYDGAVPSEDVRLAILKRKADAAEGDEKLQHVKSIQALLKEKRETRMFFKSIVQSMTNALYDSILKTSLHFTDFSCYKESVKLIMEVCPGLNLVQNDYALRNLRALANLCEEKILKEDIWSVIKRVSIKNPICKLS